jgi:predicted anti-sigma-YlaC factor YlaD
MGRQPEEGEAQIEEHLLICQSCRDKLVEVEEAIRSIREVMRSIQVERKG